MYNSLGLCHVIVNKPCRQQQRGALCCCSLPASDEIGPESTDPGHWPQLLTHSPDLHTTNVTGNFIKKWRYMNFRFLLIKRAHIAHVKCSVYIRYLPLLCLSLSKKKGLTMSMAE